MTAVATPDAARLVFAAVAGLILLLILIIKFKVHAMISILIGAVGIGLMAGMPLSDIIGSVNEGIGNTLKGIALLVGLGSMFGAILEESGGAQTLAVTMVRKFGDEKAAWALGITGLVVAMPSIAVYFILKSRISNLGSQIEMGIESVVNAIYLNKKTE